MSTFTYLITVRNPQTGASVDLEALVDMGATFSVVPEVVLRGLGIAPTRTVEMQLANSSRVRVPLGYAEIRVDGETTVGPCMFGQEGWPILLGAVTMESLLLTPDPVHAGLFKSQVG